MAAAEVVGWLKKNGVENVHPVNHGGPVAFDFGKARAVNAIHSSSFSDGSYAGNPLGFVFTTSAGNFYMAGDTALTMDMRLIGESYNLTFAALCIGDNFTMGVEDAIKAAEFVRCDEILGLHYNTFPPIQIDERQAVEKFTSAGKHLLLLHSGESHNF